MEPRNERLVKTFLSRKPKAESVYGVLLFIVLSTFFSAWAWLHPGAHEFSASGAEVFGRHEYWRLLTTTFVHADLGHLLSNLFLLSLFGFFCHSYFGLMIFPLGAVFFAALTNALTLLTYDPNITLIGASGLVYFLGGFWLVMYLGIERTRSLRSRLVRVIGVSLGVFFPTSATPNVSYRTHAIGMLLGVLIATVYFFINKKSFRRDEVYEIEVEEELGFEPLDEALPYEVSGS